MPAKFIPGNPARSAYKLDHIVKCEKRGIPVRDSRGKTWHLRLSVVRPQTVALIDLPKRTLSRAQIVTLFLVLLLVDPIVRDKHAPAQSDLGKRGRSRYSKDDIKKVNLGAFSCDCTRRFCFKDRNVLGC